MIAANTLSPDTLYAAPAWMRSPQKAGRVCVITCGRCYTYENVNPAARGGVSGPPAFVSERTGSDTRALLRWALESHIETILCCEPHRWDAPDLFADGEEDGYRFHRLTARGVGGTTVLCGMVGQRSRGGNLCTLFDLTAGDPWALEGSIRGCAGLLADQGEPLARTVASAWLLAAYAINQRLRFSPSYSGLQLLRGTLEKTARDLTPPSAWARELIAEARPSPMAWVRPGGIDPRAGRPEGRAVELLPDLPAETEIAVLLFGYDRNWSYVTSARTAPLGDPWELNSDHLRALTRGEMRPDHAGFYLVTAVAPRDYPLRAPGVFRDARSRTYPHYIADTWVWGPQARLAESQGWTLGYHAGYVWTRGQAPELLRTWSERMWDARRCCASIATRPNLQARRAGSMAEQIVKRIGVAAFGRLNQERGRTLRTVDEIEEEGGEILSYDTNAEGDLTDLATAETELGRSDLYRPEWWALGIAAANERVLSAALALPPDILAGIYIDEILTTLPVPELDGPRLRAGGFHRTHAGVYVPARETTNVQALIRAVTAAERDRRGVHA